MLAGQEISARPGRCNPARPERLARILPTFAHHDAAHWTLHRRATRSWHRPAHWPRFQPSTGEEIARCDYADRATLDRAVDVATQAGKALGPCVPRGAPGGDLLLRELMIANLNLLAEVIGREHGKTIADARANWAAPSKASNLP